jgi:MFS transporter, DHA2 family, multidrug resistance protein
LPIDPDTPATHGSGRVAAILALAGLVPAASLPLGLVPPLALRLAQGAASVS